MIVNAPKMTNAGKELLLRGLGGERLAFTRFALGSGYPTGDVTALTALSERVMDVGIKLVQQDTGGFLKLSGDFDNTDIPNDFVWRELGVYCSGEKHYIATGDGTKTQYILSDKPKELYLAYVNGTAVSASYDKSTGTVTFATAPASGKRVEIVYPSPNDVLYAYTNTQDGELLKKDTDAVVVEQTITMIVAIGEAENVTAILTADGLYAGKAEFTSHAGNRNNPHGVTKEQIGLGNVQNIEPGDMVPGMSMTGSFKAPTATSKLKEIVGQVALCVTNIKFHKLEFTNPHSVTKEQVGLGSVENVSPANMQPGMSEPSTVEPIFSTDVLSAIVGKCAKLVSEFMKHTSKENPHNITAKSVGVEVHRDLINSPYTSGYATSSYTYSGDMTNGICAIVQVEPDKNGSQCIAVTYWEYTSTGVEVHFQYKKTGSNYINVLIMPKAVE